VAVVDGRDDSWVGARPATYSAKTVLCFTRRLRHAGLALGLPTGHTCRMKQILPRLATFLAFIGTAAFAALWIAYLLHDEFGIPRQAVRTDALLSAPLAAGLLVIGRVG
jgi:hypothetical protein